MKRGIWAWLQKVIFWYVIPLFLVVMFNLIFYFPPVLFFLFYLVLFYSFCFFFFSIFLLFFLFFLSFFSSSSFSFSYFSSFFSFYSSYVSSYFPYFFFFFLFLFPFLLIFLLLFLLLFFFFFFLIFLLLFAFCISPPLHFLRLFLFPSFFSLLASSTFSSSSVSCFLCGLGGSDGRKELWLTLVCGLLSKGRAQEEIQRKDWGCFYPNGPQRCSRPNRCLCGWHARHRTQKHLQRSCQVTPEVVEDWWARSFDPKQPFQVLRCQGGDDKTRFVLASAVYADEFFQKHVGTFCTRAQGNPCRSRVFLYQEFERATFGTQSRKPTAPRIDQTCSADLRCTVVAQRPNPTWFEPCCFNGSLGANKRPERVRGSFATSVAAREFTSTSWTPPPLYYL